MFYRKVKRFLFVSLIAFVALAVFGLGVTFVLGYAQSEPNLALTIGFVTTALLIICYFLVYPPKSKRMDYAELPDLDIPPDTGLYLVGENPVPDGLSTTTAQLLYKR